MDDCTAPVVDSISNDTGWDTPAPSPAKPRTNERRTCRACGRSGLLRYLNFGLQPLADAYRDPRTPLAEEFRAPLALQACQSCKLSQLTHVVPERNAGTGLEHADDVHYFMRGVALGLASDDAITTLTMPYVGALLDTLAFDTIRHDRLNCWSVTALSEAVKRAGLLLLDVRPLHGGDISVTIARSGSPKDSVVRYLVEELHNLNRSAYMRFSSRVTRAIVRIHDELLCQTPYVGFGATAAVTVLLGVLDPRAYPYAIWSDDPRLHGMLVPGTRVPVEPSPRNWRTAPGPLCNFAGAGAVARLRAQGYDGAIYTPLPRGVWDEVE